MVSFPTFVNEIFNLSFENFIGGEFINYIAREMQLGDTMRVSARDHFKSTSFYANFLWTSLLNADRDIEGHYFSFQEKMAAYHINKIKQLKARNPYFDSCKDLKSVAESVIKYTWDGKHFHTLEPHGLLGFKRGIHCDLIYVDDPFQDPASKLVITIIDKINYIFKTQILDMVKRGGSLHIAGTPQTTQDFFFDKNLQFRFRTMILPAIVNEVKKQVLWPEWMNWETLNKKRLERGERIFKQEYLCSPTYTENAYFAKQQILDVCGLREGVGLKQKYDTKNDVVAGWDLGKKSHPSHIAVFEKVPRPSKKPLRKMIYHKFLDHMDYTKQVEFVEMLIDYLKIDKMYYDATRGELESLGEMGALPEQLKPVNFSIKTKNSMATEFEKAVINKDIEILNDQRLVDQILVVDNELNAIATPEGHGDAFWSIALSFTDNTEPEPELTIW